MWTGLRCITNPDGLDRRVAGTLFVGVTKGCVFQWKRGARSPDAEWFQAWHIIVSKDLPTYMSSSFDSSSSKAPSANPYGGAEMRATVRKAVALRVRVLLDGGVVLDGRTHDISVGGAGVLLPRSLTVKSTVQVAVQLPIPREPGEFNVMTASGKVVFQVLRGDSYQVGLQWVNLDRKTQELLQAFVDHVSNPKLKL